MRFCSNCGSAIESQQKFCPNCGAKIESSTENNYQLSIENQQITRETASINTNETVVSKKTRNHAAISVLAFILSFTYYLSPIAIALAVLDFVKNKGKKHGLSIAALIIGGLLSVLLITHTFSSCSSKTVSTSHNTEHETNQVIETTPKDCEHGYHEWKEATCTEPRTCTVCGITEGNVADHNFIDSVVIIESTCTEEGIEHKKCSVCGYVDETDVSIAPLGHTFADGTVTKESTCKDPGIEEFVCEKCGYVKDEEIPPTNNHTVEKWKVTQKPTCTMEGVQEGKCAVCGETIQSKIDKAEHTDDNEWVIIEPATDLRAGKRATHCSICGTEMRVETYELTMEEKNAYRSAKSYLNFMAFSRSGLIKQLEYEGYSKEAATIAVDSLNVDWKEQAAKCAKSYIELMSFSKSGLINQLKYEGFTQEEAEYGVAAVGY